MLWIRHHHPWSLLAEHWKIWKMDLGVKWIMIVRAIYTAQRQLFLQQVFSHKKPNSWILVDFSLFYISSHTTKKSSTAEHLVSFKASRGEIFDWNLIQIFFVCITFSLGRTKKKPYDIVCVLYEWSQTDFFYAPGGSEGPLLSRLLAYSS